MDQLPDARLPLGGADLAVEILADHDVGGQLAPGGGDLAVLLLEEDLAVLPLDGGSAGLPLDGIEGVGHVRRAEERLDHQARRRRSSACAD